MKSLVCISSLALVACARAPFASAPSRWPVKQSSSLEVRPVIAADKLGGRWLISAVDGQPSPGLWLELGGEGRVVMEPRPDGGINIVAPQPGSEAFLGCNNLRLTGWTRNGDKLSLGLEGSMMTERGCDPSTLAREEQVHAMFRLPLTMEMTPPDRLRLINERGTIDLRRDMSAISTDPVR